MRKIDQRAAAELVAAAVLSAALYVGLSAAAIGWSGDLRPIPLWLATAACVATAVVAPTKDLRWAVVAGGAVVGNVASGLWLFDETARSLVTPGLAVFVQTVLAVALLRRVLGHDVAIRRTRRSIEVLGVAVVTSAVGATIAVAETLSPVVGDRFDSWVSWALGDLVGLLVVLPLVLAPRVPLVIPREASVVRESVLSVALLVIAVAITFNMSNSAVYVIAPGILWLAIRFGPRVAAPCALFTVVAGTILTGDGHGPFLTGDHPVLHVQGFNLAVGLCSLVGGALAVRAWDDQQHLGAMVAAMPDATLIKNRSGQLLNAWIPQAMSDASVNLLSATPRSNHPLDTIDAGSVEPTIHLTLDGRTLEQRTAAMVDGRTLHLFRDISEEEERRRQLCARREQLTAAIADEQARLGKRLHNAPVQLLTAALLRIGEERSRRDSNDLDDAESMIAEAIGQLRSVSDQLVPPDVEAGGLVDTLVQFGHQFLSSPDVALASHDQSSPHVTGQTASTLYLIGREALTNVALHADASRVTIDLATSDREAILRIENDGRGLQPVDGSDRRHLGVELMRQRATALGGSLEIEAGPSGGVVVTALVPIS
ncbi:MAG: MASE1 domain-containing protein [Acidimicrobiales bacterium]